MEGQQSPICGTGPCQNIVDRLAAQMKIQNDDGIKAIKEMMAAHHTEIKEDIREIFPRLQRAELLITEIKTEIGKDGLGAKIDKAIADNNDVKFVASFRPWAAGIAAAIIIAAILSFGGLLKAVSIHLNNQPEKTEPVVKAKG